MTGPAGHVTEAELHAYFDGELALERRHAVLAYLAAHPEDADRLESYRGQDMLIRRAFRSLAERPLPPRLVQGSSGPRRRRAAAGGGQRRPPPQPSCSSWRARPPAGTAATCSRQQVRPRLPCWPMPLPPI